MYLRLCTAKSSRAGQIHSLLRQHGLHPLARNPLAASMKVGEDPRVAIELPDDEIMRGRQILAASALAAGQR